VAKPKSKLKPLLLAVNFGAFWYVVTLHGLQFTGSLPRRNLSSPLWQAFCLTTTVVSAVSPDYSTCFDRESGVPAARQRGSGQTAVSAEGDLQLWSRNATPQGISVGVCRTTAECYASLGGVVKMIESIAPKPRLGRSPETKRPSGPTAWPRPAIA